MSDNDDEHLRAHVIAQGLMLDALIDELVETRLVPAPALAARFGRSAAEQAEILPEVGNILRRRRRELMIGAARPPWGLSQGRSGSEK
jgi:hypothetical protein